MIGISKNRTFDLLNKMEAYRKKFSLAKIVFKVLASFQIICSFAIGVIGAFNDHFH